MTTPFRDLAKTKLLSARARIGGPITPELMAAVSNALGAGAMHVRFSK
jgi:hypothetical protein